MQGVKTYPSSYKRDFESYLEELAILELPIN